MHDLTAKRTLVKSPPELWSELSEVDRLARHLDAFGEIKITKLEPEHTVAWEGEAASGTVSIEPSGWGTKVTLTAQLEGAAEAEAVVEEPAPAIEEPAVEDPVAEEPVVEEPAPAAADGGTVAETEAVPEVVVEEPAEERLPEPAQAAPDGAASTPPPRRRGFLAWLFRQRTSAKEDALEPSAPPADPVVEAPAAEEDDLEPFAASEADPVAASAPEPPMASEPEPITVLEPEPIAAPAPEPAIEDPPAEDVAEAEDVTEPSPPADEQPQLDPQHAQAVLDEVLDTLGSAHHRPFSRG